jgi:NADH dehydrogenase [ubiquinone] 1 alpha subcomplex assembly factor 1
MACRAEIAAGFIGVVILLTGCSNESVIETPGQPSVDVPSTTVSNESPVPTTDQTTSTAASSTDASSTTVAPADLVEADDSVFSFASGDDVGRWNVVNDTVMGGVSSGELTWAGEAMVFTGELSLDNNGGFASVRSPLVDPRVAARWAEQPGLRLEMRGDGRSWAVNVRDSGASGGWIATVTPPVDEFASIEIPWRDFTPVTRFLDPRQSNEPLDPSRIALIALYLIDGVEERFRLEVRSIT